MQITLTAIPITSQNSDADRAKDRDAGAGKSQILEYDRYKTTIWLTGLPCSGKTTIANYIHQQIPNSVVLDGDDVRKSLNSDLGFTPQDRKENLRRISEMAKIILDSVPVVIISVVSPRQEVRDAARELIEGEEVRFYEVFVDAPLETCIERDVKGMYKKALAGEIPFFTGIGAPYECPKHPDIVCHTAVETLEESANKILKVLRD
ncbi:MAG: adenylyl-sulfate kinase [Chlamydiia bacterium]|nr:adenylyl-sulfate kinase [Chlamydiia bacterium]